MLLSRKFLKTLVMAALIAALPAGCKHWSDGTTFERPTIERDGGGGGGGSGGY